MLSNAFLIINYDINIYCRKMTSRQRARKDREKANNNLELKILMDEHAGLTVIKIIYKRTIFYKNTFFNIIFNIISEKNYKR